MKYRNLGTSGFPVAEVGLGCWQFGGDFGEMSEKTAFAIMEKAVEKGIDFFDTADVYGGGRSEKLIGRFLQQSGTNIRVATKFGRGSGVFPDGYSRESLRRGIDASRKRLGVDRIDLLQLHCIPTKTMQQGDIFDWLRTEQSAGTIARFGASVETVDEAILCLQQEGILSLQVIFNIFRQKLVDELLPLAKQKGVGIIARLPLASGLLSGKFTRETRFAASDHRNYNCDGQFFNVGETFAGLPFLKGIELAEATKSMLPDDAPMAQQSLRWILDHDAVSVIIPGASTVRQVESNAAASELPRLGDATHARLRQFYTDHVAERIRGAY